MAGLFADHMVLQQDRVVPVWGWTAPGEQVTIEFAGQRKTASAAPDGHWQVLLDPLPANGQPQEMRVQASDHSSLTLRDILVGEVWLCSGQSNMEMALGELPSVAEEIVLPPDPLFRAFNVRKTYAEEPSPAVPPGQWFGMDSNRVRNVSATAYFFGKRLRQDLKVPIGVIVAAWGGTPVEAWMPRAAFADDPDTEAIALEKLAAAQAGRKTNEVFLAAGGDPKKLPWPEWRIAPTPAWLFNGMIHPLIPYALRGAIWYQGEANVGNPLPYGKLFPALIRSWRRAWGGTDFPFCFVQLPGIKLDPSQTGKLATLRAMQAKALALPNTGMAVIYDTAEEEDNHPKNKRPAGERLARVALAKAYEKTVEYSGPTYAGMAIEGDQVRIRFTHLGGGLVAREIPKEYRPRGAKPELRPVVRTSPGSPLEGFQVRGPDGGWQWAEARIEGDTVVVRSSLVPHPAAVRYGWADFGFFNLFNQAGLPAAPFESEEGACAK